MTSDPMIDIGKMKIPATSIGGPVMANLTQNLNESRLNALEERVSAIESRPATSPAADTRPCYFCSKWGFCPMCREHIDRLAPQQQKPIQPALCPCCADTGRNLKDGRPCDWECGKGKPAPTSPTAESAIMHEPRLGV